MTDDEAKQRHFSLEDAREKRAVEDLQLRRDELALRLEAERREANWVRRHSTVLVGALSLVGLFMGSLVTGWFNRAIQREKMAIDLFNEYLAFDCSSARGVESVVRAARAGILDDLPPTLLAELKRVRIGGLPGTAVTVTITASPPGDLDPSFFNIRTSMCTRPMEPTQVPSPAATIPAIEQTSSTIVPGTGTSSTTTSSTVPPVSERADIVSFSKNEHFGEPGGRGTMIHFTSNELPGRIVSIEGPRLNGEGCPWVDVHWVTGVGSSRLTFEGSSNSGAPCQISFLVHYSVTGTR